jgi:hypothetical protein
MGRQHEIVITWKLGAPGFTHPRFIPVCLGGLRQVTFPSCLSVVTRWANTWGCLVSAPHSSLSRDSLFSQAVPCPYWGWEDFLPPWLEKR